MPPQVDLFSALRSASSHNVSQQLLSLTTRRCASTSAQKRRKYQDPYALAQARARRTANLSRQEALQTERSKALGDPVRGITTPFVESFDDARTADSPSFLNHFVRATDLSAQLEASRKLAAPVFAAPHLRDPDEEAMRTKMFEDDHERARDALRRITGLENSSSKDRTRTNIERCIDTFGRHNTDKTLKPRPSVVPKEIGDAESPVDVDGIAVGARSRVGADTGSSEVQIAILTVKIRTLANFLETRGRNDKMNKRNLRLLVHKRQKLLRYLRKKERGGERWQHLISTLGLTEGTWQGEITL